MVFVMVHCQHNRLAQVGERGCQRRGRPESDEMHRADFGFMTVTAFEQPKSLLASGANRDGFSVIESHEYVEPFFHPVLLCNLNQQRGAQLTVPRHEGIIYIQLILDFVGVEDVLDSDHFLSLKPQRLTIFENERDERPDGNPAPLLERNDLRTKLFPLPFIVSRGQQISLYKWLHRLACVSRLTFHEQRLTHYDRNP